MRAAVAWIGLAAGCAGADAGAPTGTNPFAVTTVPADWAPDGTFQGCDRSYPASYDGADSGEMVVVFDAPSMTMSFASPDGSDMKLKGKLDVDPDGSMFGSNDDGFWVDGTLSVNTCAADGSWGNVALPGVVAGNWQTTP